MVKVKICGITNYEDAKCAVDLGADALGFIFAQSPRRIDPEGARHVITKLPPLVQTVGVFVDENIESILKISEYCGIDLIQLHGNEPPDLCRKLMPRTIKAFRLSGASSLKAIEAYRGTVRAFLFDTYQKGLKGGTGKTFDWNLAVEAKAIGPPIFLSGGLGPSNIEAAISTVRPFAVDVNSGIEERPGKKNLDMMKTFIERVNNINCNCSPG